MQPDCEALFKSLICLHSFSKSTATSDGNWQKVDSLGERLEQRRTFISQQTFGIEKEKVDVSSVVNEVGI